MKALIQRIEKVNGFGWLIGLVVQIVYTTIAVCVLYFGLVRRIDAVEGRVALNAMADSARIVRLEQMIVDLKGHVSSLWIRAQHEHKELARRSGFQWDMKEE